MSNERRTSATRTTQPIHLLRETRFMSRDEVLRELRKQNITGQYPAARPSGPQQRGGSSD